MSGSRDHRLVSKAMFNIAHLCHIGLKISGFAIHEASLTDRSVDRATTSVCRTNVTCVHADEAKYRTCLAIAGRMIAAPCSLQVVVIIYERGSIL